MFIKYPHLLTVVRRGDNVDVAEKMYVCIMELKKRVSRVSIMPGIVFFMKAKRGLEMLPPTHYVLELHVKRPHYEAKIWLQAGHAIISLENEPTETNG